MSELRELPVAPTNQVFTVSTTADLPTVGAYGEMYFVLAEKAIYFWDSTTWKKLATA